MSSKTSPNFTSAIHPPVGTFIDGGNLELVEVLGVGGYGVVYRAIDARHPSGPKSYAVKCLVASGHQSPRQKQVHIREITLHQIASAHPGVVTLHRVVEQHNHTYIVMDYAPDHDLFTQILHSCRYLGDDQLIKDVFLQLLDAVEYCHSLHIYHRDLKPENILCYSDGLRVAITDFGLATTAELSDEFRTGSVYHMSPECQGGEFAPTGMYSPKFNDIWSLGIILLNLATGRNPWKSATPNDPTFQAYLRDPMGFLPSVLPISPEANEILVRMLEVDWRERATLREVRYAIEEISSFYSDGVIFEGSMARCPWEQGMDIDSASSGTNPEEPASPVSPQSQGRSTAAAAAEEVDLNFVSQWSKESTSDIVFASRSLAQDSSYGPEWAAYSSSGATWAFESPITSDFERDRFPMDLIQDDDEDEDSGASTPSSTTQTPASSAPTTPNCMDLTFGSRPQLHLNLKGVTPTSQRLMINTHNLPKPHIYDATDPSMESAEDTMTTLMHTAIEYDPYSSMFFVNSPNSPSKGLIVVPASTAPSPRRSPAHNLTMLHSTDDDLDKEMISPSVWTSSESSYSASSVNSSVLDQSSPLVFSRNDTPELPLDDDDEYFNDGHAESRRRAASDPLTWTPFFRHQPEQFRLGGSLARRSFRLEAEPVAIESPQSKVASPNPYMMVHTNPTCQLPPLPSMSSRSMTDVFSSSRQPQTNTKKRHDSAPAGPVHEAAEPRSICAPVPITTPAPIPPATEQTPPGPTRRPSSPALLFARLAGKLFNRSNSPGRSRSSSPSPGRNKTPTPNPSTQTRSIPQSVDVPTPTTSTPARTPANSPIPPAIIPHGMFFSVQPSTGGHLDEDDEKEYQPWSVRTQMPNIPLPVASTPVSVPLPTATKAAVAAASQVVVGCLDHTIGQGGKRQQQGHQLQRTTKHWFLPGRFRALHGHGAATTALVGVLN